MIRLITARDERGIPTEWTDYPDREVGEVPGTLALRFDAELFGVKLAGLDLGVKRWTAAKARSVRFRVQVVEEMERLWSPESDVPDAERGLALEEWVSDHPDYLLVQQVAIWSAVNMGGGRMTLLDVLELADRDVEDIPDPPPFLPDDDPEDDEGKA